MIRFEAYTPDDRDACRRIVAANHPKFFSEEDIALFDEFLDEGVNSEDVAFWTVREDDAIIGFCGLERDEEPSSAHVAWGVVDPEHQGRGLGRQLLEHRLTWLRAHWSEVRFVQAMTAPATEGFFARFGFVTFHRESDYWGEGYHLAHMLLDLAPDRWTVTSPSN